MLKVQTIKQQLLEGNLNVVLTRYSDIILAVLVIAIIGIMIVPIPPFLMDILLATNITLAVTLLMVSLYIPNALSLAAFPTILLVTTLFRLSLNVSSTRLILLYAYAGEVINSFGQFVVKGNFVVGGVIFLVLTLIQFIVIAKGAERVSEVSARFTLDAMPGKQMSIDADLRAGLIDVDTARKRRESLSRESQFYGAMDGAMKFVKGDAIAGIIISVINIVAGLIIGVMMKHYALAMAVKKYTLLTIGDGLVSQIPSLIISTAAGIITTRVASSEEGASLGQEIGFQLLAQPKAIAIAGGMLACLGLIPGLPTMPFLTLALFSGVIAWGLMRTKERKDKEAVKAQVMESRKELKKGEEAVKLPLTVPVILETSPAITRYVDVEVDGGRFIQELIPQMREWLFQELGVVFPGIRVRGDAAYLEDFTYAIYVNEIPMVTGTAYPDCVFTSDNLEQLTLMGIGGHQGLHPSGDKNGLWVSKSDIQSAQSLGAPVMQPDEYIAVHLANTLKKHADEIIGIQDVQNVLDLMEQQGYAALVKSVVPRLVSIQRLTDILKRLLRENISIKNMKAILEALAEWAAFENDPIYLTEYVRMNLKRYIAYRFSGGNSMISVFLLDPQIEESIKQGIQQSASGSYLSLDPSVSQRIMGALRNTFGSLDLTEHQPIVLTQMEVRYFVKRLLDFEFPKVSVLSFQELPADLRIQPVGRIEFSKSLEEG